MNRVGQLGEEAGSDEGVAVQEEGISSGVACQLQSDVRAANEAAVLSLAVEEDPRVLCRDADQGCYEFRVRARVIDDDETPIAARVLANAVDASKRVFACSVHGDDDIDGVLVRAAE